MKNICRIIDLNFLCISIIRKEIIRIIKHLFNNKFILVKTFLSRMFQKVIKIIDLYYINLLNLLNLLLSQKDILNRKQNELYDTKDL